MKEKYIELHKQFVSDDEVRPLFMKTNFFDNFSVSTEMHMCFISPYIKDIENQKDISDKMENVFDIDECKKTIQTFNIENINEAFSKCSMIDEEKVIREEIECDACEGDGDVYWSFSHNLKSYEILENCPVCGGDGIETSELAEKTGNKIKDLNQVFKIRDTYFFYKYISKLALIAETLVIKDIHLVFESDMRFIFQIGECYFVVMGMLYDNEPFIEIK